MMGPEETRDILGASAAIPVRRDYPSNDISMLLKIIERAAFQPEFDLDRIGQLLDLKERWEAAGKKSAFALAMVEFKRQAPTLLKDKHVKFTNRAGTVTEYDHATHFEVTSKITEGLAAHGITHDWSVIQAENRITVTCTLTHIAGFEKSVSLYSLSDDSGGKNSIQAVASANSYLQRYTLLAVTGMSTVDMPDDDGVSAGAAVKPDVSADVWVCLGDASREGSAALGEAWRGLSDVTRATIVLHYPTDWGRLKDQAAAVTATP